MDDVLSAEQAREVITEVRHRHGLGQRYEVELETSGNRWVVIDREGKRAELEPMPRKAWEAWLERFFVEPIFEHDKTTEG